MEERDLLMSDLFALPSNGFHFHRNILIIGAKASKEAYDFIGDANDVITSVEESPELNLEDLLESNPGLKRKYFEMASRLNNSVYETDDLIKDVKNELTFENRLSLLEHFYSKNDVLKALKGKVSLKYLPSKFYEIVAHMFKHRFIDVIVNFNFDELLDNAIDDEMSPNTYHKILSEGDFTDIEELMSKGRLREPIYIKPHGSTERPMSMLYTTNQYIEIPDGIKSLLNQIFLGEVGGEPSSNSNIKYFNIMIAGYGMKDMDLRNILINQALETVGGDNSRIKQINYFFWEAVPGRKFGKKVDNISNKEDFEKESFYERILDWISDVKKKDVFEDESFYNDCLKALARKCKASNLDTDFKKKAFIAGLNDLNERLISFEMPYEETTESFGGNFEKLYTKIVENFRDPFKPRNLYRHKLHNIVFPKIEIQSYYRRLKDNKDLGVFYNDIFYYRALVNAVYDFVKHGFQLSNSLYEVSHAAKYHNLYVKYNRSRSFPEKEHCIDVIYGCLNNPEYKAKRTCDGITLDIERKEREKHKEKVIENLMDLLIRKSPFFGQNKPVLPELKLLLENAFGSNTKQISSYYEDPKFLKFSNLTNRHVVTTNLALTYRMFNFITSIIRKQENPHPFDTLLLLDETGQALYNLHHLSSDTSDTWFKRCLANKRVIHFHTCNKESMVRNVDGNTNIDDLKYLSNQFNCAYESHDVSELGLKKSILLGLKNNEYRSDQKSICVFAIFIDEPTSMNRINPLVFSNKRPHRHEQEIKNMELIRNMFIELSMTKRKKIDF